MQTTSVRLELAAVQVPTPVFQQQLRWIEWGPKHAWMKTVLGLIKGSPTAKALLAKKAQFVAGQGFTCDAEAYPPLHAFLKKTATKGKYRTANALLKRTAKDLVKLQAFAWQVLWSADGKYIVELRHQRIETVASGPFNEELEVETYWLCRDWAQQSKYPPKPIAAFNPATAKRDKVQLLFWFDEDTGGEYYPQLSYEPALNDMQAEGRLGKYRDSRIATRFGGKNVLSVWKGPEDETKTDAQGKPYTITAASKRTAFEANVKKTYTGEEAEELMIVYGDGTAEGAQKMVQVQALSTAPPEAYDTIAKQCREAILAVGGVTSPRVIGLPGEGGLGDGGGEIRAAYEIFHNAECRPLQVDLLEVLYEKVLPHVQGVGEVPGLDDDEPALDILAANPVPLRFSADTVAQVLDDDEIRATEGYNPRPKEGEGDEVQQTEAQKQLAASVGGQTSIDAMLSLLAQKLTTRESCIARLKTFFGLSQQQAEDIVPLPQQETTTVAPGAI